MQPATTVDPFVIFETINSHQKSYIIKAAVELDVITLIAEGRKTAAEIAGACGAAERGVRILCDCLTVMNFLSKTGSEYSLNDVSAAFLSRRSPTYVGTTIEFLLSDKMVEGFSRLTEAVRQGGTALPGKGTVSDEDPVWVKFARAMMPMMMPAAQMIPEKLNFEPQKKLKILDIAAGHGIFGIMIAKSFPNAEIYAVDWKGVLEVARENAEKFGVADRYRAIEGSAFEVDFGRDYDVVLLTNFLHHFEPPTCERLLRKIHGALKDDGKVLTLEFVPDENRVSPPPAAMFAAIMLATTPAGDAYTFSEFEKMFANAGFADSEIHPLGPLPQQLIISSK